MTPTRTDDPLAILRRFAPGTELRDVVDLILRQRTGALILFGSGPEVDAVCSGGFILDDADSSPTRVAELAKMDGGIVISADATKILRANVQFIPNPKLATLETGTRFRTAERLAKQTGLAVLAISEEGSALAVVYSGDERYTLRTPSELHAEANQNLVSLERLRRRLEASVDHLTITELNGVATVRDVVGVLEKVALVRRMGAQINRIVVELGGGAHLTSIQTADLLDGVDDLGERIYDDYAPSRRRKSVFDKLAKIPTEKLHDAAHVAEEMGFGQVDELVQPRGFRALATVPRLPDPVRRDLVRHFGSLSRLKTATVAELAEVDGVGSSRAELVYGYLDRLGNGDTG